MRLCRAFCVRVSGTKVKEKNPGYANLLSIDYCGAVSELSAITQYINNENRLSCENCPVAKTLLGIAVAEMMHIRMIKDEGVNAVLKRLIKDEEYHIMLLRALAEGE